MWLGIFVGGFMAIFTNNLSNVWRLFLLISLLSACQSSGYLDDKELIVAQNLYSDNYFPNYKKIQIETEEDIFALDARMRLMVKEKLIPVHDIKKRSIKLLEQIFDQNNVALEYNPSANVNARDVFNNQAANCLSLTIMAYSLAREAGLNVNFHDVKIPEYWVRNGNNNMLSGHVNLTISRPLKSSSYIFMGDNILTIDFDPYISRKNFPKKAISKSVVVAMFYSNKGGQAILNGEFEKAYAYIKKATQIAPQYSPSWGNLGVLYKSIHQDDYALRAYRFAIELDRNNYNAMANMSLLLSRRGENNEVKEIQKFLHNKRSKNPYYHAMQADRAFYNGRNELAIANYQKAISLARKVPEFHFELAKVYYSMNEKSKAKKSIKRAILYNRTAAIEERYIAKLNVMNQASLTH